MTENKKIALFEGIASLLGILSFVRLFLPAYWENGKASIPLIQRIFGNERLDFSPLLFVGFLILVISVLLSILLALCALTKKRYNDKTVTALGITSGVLFLVAAVILGLCIIVTGLYKENSELGLVQGNWGIGIGNILVALFSFIAFILSYPAARIIPHHLDRKDKKTAKTEAEVK